MNLDPLYFFDQSEMGKLARAFDWSKTSLGPAQGWPLSLKTTLASMFRHHHPMFVFWGADNICFYNDSYVPSFGVGKHPLALGQKGIECWTESWHIIGPYLEQVKKDGKNIWNVDHMIPIFRDGSLQEAYWTYSYSPIFSDQGNIEGALVAIQETTETVIAEKQLRSSEEKLLGGLLERERLLRELKVKSNQIEKANDVLEVIFDKSPAFVAVFKGPKFIFEKVNASYYEIVGRTDIIGKPFAEALPELADQGCPELLEQVYLTGESFAARDVSVLLRHQPEGPLVQKYVDLVFQQTKDKDGKPLGVLAHGFDVTEKVIARQQLELEKHNLNVALESAQMGTWYVDLKNNQIMASDLVASILGVKLEAGFLELKRRLIHPDDLVEADKLLTEAVKNQTLYQHEYRIIRPDGELRWLYSACRATYDRAHKPVAISGVTLDITQRKEAEQVIVASENRIRLFAETMPQMAFISDAEGNMLYFNERFYNYFGFLPDDINGKKWEKSELQHPEDIERTIATWRESLKTGKPYQIEYRLQRYDGEYRWHLGRATPIRDKNNRIVQWYGTNTDIHDQKMHEAELRKAKEQAEEASRSKSAFLANMSHEIRTPLGAILGFTELLKDAQTLVEKTEYADVIARNGKSLTKIIDDILDLSKVEAGRLQLERIDFRLDEMIEEIMGLFQESAKNNKVFLKISLDPATPQYVNSDPTRIRQILINLLGNAVKFTKDGSVEICVKPTFVNNQLKQIQFGITDTGVGMTDEQAAKLFEPFSQADNSTTRKFGGSGLGLVLSRRLARALGGDVVLKSYAPQKGCVFIATVEAQLSEQTQEVKVDYRFHSDAHTSKTLQYQGEPRAHVLLVEDSQDNQLLFSLLLQKEGIQVDVASNGIEGIQKAQKKDYDVILMDMQMPVLDGYAATEELRSNGYNRPIIALTAHAMSEERQRVFDAGCNAHLTKPVNSELLLKTIQDLSQQGHH